MSASARKNSRFIPGSLDHSLKRDAKGRPTDVERTKGIVDGLTSFGEDAMGELYAAATSGDLYGLAAG